MQVYTDLTTAIAAPGRQRHFDRWAWLTLAAGLGIMAITFSM